MNDLMIDIETLGKAPGSVILSIGAVWFNAETGELGDEYYAAINPQSAINSGLRMDVSTVQWWMKQSEEAREAAFSGERILSWALGELGDFVRKSEAKRIWAKPPSFDLVLLEAAFVACSIPIPWEYWTPRDCRTLFEISKVKQTAFGTAHNALDDAKAQAAGVIEAYRVLGLSEPPPATKVAPSPAQNKETLQARVQPWMMACFGPEISADKLERGDRLLEELFELLQSGDYPRERIRALENYTWSRPRGEPPQEVGGVMITLAAYCLAHDLDMHQCGETELARIWTKVEAIRAKQAAKPTGSALPVAAAASEGSAE